MPARAALSTTAALPAKDCGQPGGSSAEDARRRDASDCFSRASLSVGLLSVGLSSAGAASGTHSFSEVSAVSWTSCVLTPKRVRRPPPAMRFCLQRCLLLLL